MSAPDLQGNDLKSNKLKKLSRHRNYYVRQAYQYFASQRWQEALSRFEYALRERSTDAGLYHRKGDCLYNLRRYREALEAYEQAIRLKSGKKKTKPSLLVCTNKKANALEKISGEKKSIASQRSVLRAENSISSTYRPVGQITPTPSVPSPRVNQDGEKYVASQRPSIYEGQTIPGGTTWHRAPLVPGTGQPYHPGPLGPSGTPFPRGPLGPGGVPFRPPFKPPGC